MRASNNQALLALLASIASRAVAENPILPQWRPSLPTQGLDPYDRVNLQISPRPTKSPQFNPKDLRRRADDTSIGSNTCGFLTGDRKCSVGLVGLSLPVSAIRKVQRSSILIGPQTALSLAMRDTHAPTSGTTEVAAEAPTAQLRPSRLCVSTLRRRRARATLQELCAGRWHPPNFFNKIVFHEKKQK